MSTDLDPITAYAEYVAAQARVDELNAQRRAIYDPRVGGPVADAEAWDRNIDAAHELIERMHGGPDAELLRICWVVDHWDESVTPAERDGDGELTLGGTMWNDERDDAPTLAEDIRWLVDVLVAELRRLRPELAADGAT